MSNKYIIRNCPALVGCRAEQDLCYKNELHKCQDCTDCVIKQVIEKCKKIAKDHYWGMREIRFSKEILQLFDIEEINK